MNLFYRTTSLLLRGYFTLFYHYSVFGANEACPGKAIIAPNHASFLDPPLIGASWPEEIHYLARASLFRYRLWGWILKKLNAHPIQGNAQDIGSIRMICQLLNEGKKVVVFPEGERSATGELQAIKSGIAMLALRTNSPIIPVYISGAFEAWPRHSRLPKFGTAITCVFGKPIFSPQPEDKNKKRAQEELTQKIQTRLVALRQWVEAGAKGNPP